MTARLAQNTRAVSKYSENSVAAGDGPAYRRCGKQASVMSRESAPAKTITKESLREARERFVALWGQMASNWGIPRTMAEVHALLFISDAPLNTDQVMQGLNISRGNASMTLRALQEWGIVSRVHIRGDRKEYFQAEQDVWKLFRTILRERKKREIDPLLEALRACRDLTASGPGSASGSGGGGGSGNRRIGPDASAVAAHNARLDSMLDFIAMIDSISQRLMVSGKGLQLAAKLLAKAS
jgi:HTH-type transcriptional regulator, glycine betaine synthesis regulator